MPAHAPSVGRRALLGWAGGASLALTAVTAGQTVPFLRRFVLFAPRRPDIGSQGLPVNRAASEAGVVDRAQDPQWRLIVEVDGVERAALDLAALALLPQRSATLPIACVEGWSATPRWSGVSVIDVLGHASVTTFESVEVVSLEDDGLYSRSILNSSQARRSRHDPRDDVEWRDAQPRSRLPHPTHRTESAGRDANQMGYPNGGSMTPPTPAQSRSAVLGDGRRRVGTHPVRHTGIIDEPQRNASRRVLPAGSSDSRSFTTRSLVPAVLLIAWTIGRIVPRRAVVPVRLGLATTGLLVLYAWPLVRGYGRSESNPSALPLDYSRNLVVSLLVIWLGVGIWITATSLHASSPPTEATTGRTHK